MFGAENTTVKIEVEPPHLWIVFDRKCDHFIAPWQDMYGLYEILRQAIMDITPAPGTEGPLDSVRLTAECDQIKLRAVTKTKARGLVALFFAHTDRLRFTWRSASMLRDALGIVTQDAQLACKGLHFVYNAKGMIRELHNLQTGTVQVIPGR